MQQRGPLVAFGGANAIILVARLRLPDLSTQDALEDWRGTMCRFAQQRVEYILHSWVTKPHDVILMLTQGLFCACYPVDKGQIKSRATMETSGIL